jgi:hypothetical protein
MRFVKRRHIEPAFYDARSQKFRRIKSHRVKRCAVCTYEFPEADMIIEDGQERCPLCADLYTAEWLALEEAHVAHVKEESATRLVNPPQFSTRSLLENQPGAITLITDANLNELSSSSPLTLYHGGAAASVLLTGQRFTSAMAFTYSSTKISNNAAPVITPTLITLSLIVAASGNLPGAYDLSVTDGVTVNAHIYPGVFAVR